MRGFEIWVPVVLLAVTMAGNSGRGADPKQAEKSVAGGWAALLPKATHDQFHRIEMDLRLEDKDNYAERIRAFVAIEPKNALVLTCAAGLSSLFDDFDLGLKYANAALAVDPKEPKAWQMR